MTSFISQADLLTAVPGAIYSFEGATLKAQTLPTTANSKEVATTEWVNTLLGITPSVPVVMDAGGLNVNYTSGTVSNPFTGAPIQVSGSVIGLAVGASTVEYIWVRYLDGAVVASSVRPLNNSGYLLATVTTNATNIISIVSNSSATGWAPINSPAFVGTVTAPTPPLTDNSNTVPTTSWVRELLQGTTGWAPINSPAFVGTVTAPIPPVADNSNTVPTTSWVRGMVQSALVGSDHPTLSIGNSGTSVLWTAGVVSISGAQYPVIAGQYTFTASSQGVYSVYAVLVGGVTTVVVSATAPTSPNVLMGSVSVSGGAVGQVNLPPTTGFAPIASPVFTGDPQVPTPPVGDNDSTIPNTLWVNNTINAKGYAPIASPAFTGNPTAPTPPINDRDNSIATTGWVVDMVTTKMVVGFGGYVAYVP